MATFIVSGVLVSVLSDWLTTRLSRPLLLAAGCLTFSTCCLLMGLAGRYWQLAALRMGVAVGVSVFRPIRLLQHNNTHSCEI